MTYVSSSDGNGRGSRLLTLLLMHKSGFNIGKYVSFEEQMDETSVPYEQNENPFPQTDLDDEFETMIINKYHLTTKEMEDTN